MPVSKPPSSRDESASAKLSKKMSEIALAQKEKDAQDLSTRLGIGYVNLKGIPIPPGPLSVIDQDEAQRLQIVCFEDKPGEKWIAAIDPEREAVRDFVQKMQHDLNVKVLLYTTSAESLAAAHKLYAMIPKVAVEETGVHITEDDIAKYKEGFTDIRKLQEQIQGVSLTEVLTLLIAVALNTGASDIHIEAEEQDIIMRLRIDGTLHQVASLPHDTWQRVISRIKLISGVKINISDRPQDGRFTIFLKSDTVDVRVSMIPTAYGESVVMRLLKASSAGLSFDQLGLHPHVYETMKKAIEKPNGMLITTGPTGSGKTTTLYAILNKLNSSEVKIITLEDPVEYKLKGINQSQIDPTHEYTFAGGLRSILRQDPDVVMVGEIRDLETAEIAINAALTGHLVISTIHTNSAAGAIPRFLAMEVKPFLLAPALNAVIGQRLVRRLCVECKTEAVLSPEVMSQVKEYLAPIAASSKPVAIDLEALKFYTAPGCEVCHGIGYKGRIGIYEIMNMSTEIEKSISSGEVAEAIIEEIAIRQGMIKMVQDGLLWALEGVTSVEEVFEAAQ